MPAQLHVPLGAKTTHRHIDIEEAFPKISVPSDADAFTSLSSPATETQKAFESSRALGDGRGKEKEGRRDR